jgi:hypothetical protein
MTVIFCENKECRHNKKHEFIDNTTALICDKEDINIMSVQLTMKEIYMCRSNKE